MREREVATVNKLRKQYARQFDVAERILDFGYSLVVGRQVTNPGGDVLVGRVLLALYAASVPGTGEYSPPESIEGGLDGLKIVPCTIS